MTEIRELNTIDIDDYHSLVSEAIHDQHIVYAWGVYDESHIPKEYLAHLLSEHNTNERVFGLYLDQSLVGVATLIHSSVYGLRHKGILQNMCVKMIDHHASQDLAEELMNYIVRFCQHNGIEIIMTSIASNNISAKIFYRKYNFDTLGVEQHARKLGNKYIDEHWLVTDIRQ
ncbi:GNAT family N-acetyltransferase [Staphylococcus sp. SQ8-PEA]|uniref:GNAT family N-acetyltransferase n=1 Tax=Staphylococcus marylandisciuri TaxID=2981529 RepID=A0ABT2QSX6_9STAP|nr:GNAT family N-acetyltransferase [Staphylococcus marylandisciuri]MCU5747079.1 GNAT family N-acetyltransferase [Staphylococcus marylandisciuri]